MNLLGPTALGFLIVALLAGLVAVKRFATGSGPNKPVGPLPVRLINTFNIYFLAAVNSAVAVLLFVHRLPAADPTHVSFGNPAVRIAVDILGLALFVGGYGVMYWALVVLGRNYQIGGSIPRSSDRMVTRGPYGVVRHPVYLGLLSLSLGLGLLVQSPALVLLFGFYVASVLLLIRVEERGLRRAYGEEYAAYLRRRSRLIPFVY